MLLRIAVFSDISRVLIFAEEAINKLFMKLLY